MNYFSPLTSEEEESILTVNELQKVTNNSDKNSEAESEFSSESLSDRTPKITGSKRRRKEDVTPGITPKGKRKKRHSKEDQEKKNVLEESLKKFLTLTEKTKN